MNVVPTLAAARRFWAGVIFDRLFKAISELPRFCVEVYADALPGGPAERHVMNVEDAEASSAGSYLYSVRIPATRSASDYTARVIAQNPDAIIPLEAPQILWQR